MCVCVCVCVRVCVCVCVCVWKRERERERERERMKVKVKWKKNEDNTGNKITSSRYENSFIKNAILFHKNKKKINYMEQGGKKHDPSILKNILLILFFNILWFYLRFRPYCICCIFSFFVLHDLKYSIVFKF